MVEQKCDVTAAMEKLGIEQVDESEMVELCRELLRDNPRVVSDVKQGKQKAIGALIGQAKKRNPNANPGEIRNICLELIEQM